MNDSISENTNYDSDNKCAYCNRQVDNIEFHPQLLDYVCIDCIENETYECPICQCRKRCAYEEDDIFTDVTNKTKYKYLKIDINDKIRRYINKPKQNNNCGYPCFG